MAMPVLLSRRLAGPMLMLAAMSAACSPTAGDRVGHGTTTKVAVPVPDGAPFTTTAVPGGAPSMPSDTSGPYTVLDVVDGDTLKVDRDGKRTTIRVIGLDTPETRDPRKPVQCFGREASRQAHTLLDGHQVRLSSDPTQDAVDKYGRMLAYVWLPDGRLFQYVMIAEGYGHEYTYEIPYEHQDAFKAAQRSAREQGRGLWSPQSCNGDTGQPESPDAATSAG